MLLKCTGRFLAYFFNVAVSKAPSDEGAGTAQAVTEGEKAKYELPEYLSLRLLLRKIHRPRQRKAFL